MNRRGFFCLLGGTIAGLVLDEAIPFGRVWSFPSAIVIPRTILLNQTFGICAEWGDYEEMVNAKPDEFMLHYADRAKVEGVALT